MSNRQADALRLDVLASEGIDRPYLALKPARISAKKFDKLREGDLIDGFDPLHLRVVHDGAVIARAKLGRIGRREAIHIVSTEREVLASGSSPRHRLLEVRLQLMGASALVRGDVIEYDEPLSRSLVILADRRPFALGEMVEYDGEPTVRITRMLDG